LVSVKVENFLTGRTLDFSRKPRVAGFYGMVLRAEGLSMVVIFISYSVLFVHLRHRLFLCALWPEGLSLSSTLNFTVGKKKKTRCFIS
jgi:hypothetical protein